MMNSQKNIKLSILPYLIKIITLYLWSLPVLKKYFN
jgi:hypothetical protein